MPGTLVEIHTTEAGHTLFARADARVAELDALLAGELTTAELKILTSLLTRVADTARRQYGAGS